MFMTQKFCLTLSTLILASSTALANTMINGAGSTFAEPILTKWFSEFQKQKKDVSINYQGIGSGGGIRQMIAGTVDFAATDAPMLEAETAKLSKKVMHIPVALGAVVVSYNLDLAQPLKLSGSVVGEIFTGAIKTWNDPKIAALNAGVALPAMPIIVATRSDGSGTTAVFSEYLEAVSPLWKGKASKTVNWFRGSMGAKGNAGVAGLIQQAKGTVGYIESIYAIQNKLPYAQIQNKAGQFTTPDSASISASIPAKTVGDIEKKDFKVSVVNADAKTAYPISALTWMLVFEEMPKEKGQPLISMIEWALTDAGQKFAEDLSYAPLPKELRGKVLNRLKSAKLQ